jgi:hypothetical protein
MTRFPVRCRPILEHLVDVEVTDYEIHVPVDDSETFLRGELAHGYRSMFDVLDRVAVFAKGVEPRR